MKTTMKMRDLRKKDGFPENIDRSKTIVVQIRNVNVSSHPNTMMYSDKYNGDQCIYLLPIEIGYRYKEGLYIIKP
jgi:competence CoiA-like predicted nuclease